MCNKSKVKYKNMEILRNDIIFQEEKRILEFLTSSDIIKHRKQKGGFG